MRKSKFFLKQKLGLTNFEIFKYESNFVLNFQIFWTALGF